MPKSTGGKRKSERQSKESAVELEAVEILEGSSVRFQLFSEAHSSLEA